MYKVMSSPAPPDTTSVLKATIGVFLVGILFSICIFGVNSLQTWYYYQRYPKDTTFLKIVVAFVWGSEALHAILACHAVWFFLIGAFGDDAQVNTTSWAASVTDGFADLLFTETHPERSVAMKFLAGSGICMSLAIDIVAAVSLGYPLHKTRPGSTRTKHTIHKLLFWGANIVILACLAGFAAKVLEFAEGVESLAYLALYEVVGNMYTASMLATLNTRSISHLEDHTTAAISLNRRYTLLTRNVIVEGEGIVEYTMCSSHSALFGGVILTVVVRNSDVIFARRLHEPIPNCPDLGIGGAQRLVVDAALGLQKPWSPQTRDGTLHIRHVVPSFPRSIRVKFHILFAHARQLHLTLHLLLRGGPSYDIYFVAQLSTQTLGQRRIRRGQVRKDERGDSETSISNWVEELTTNIILANSRFGTSQVFPTYFRSVPRVPRVVYPGINISAYETAVDLCDPDIVRILSDRPTLLSLNRFEKKKNVALALAAFAQMKTGSTRLVIGGGYDHRLQDNIETLASLVKTAESHSLTFNIITPQSSSTPVPPFNCQPPDPDILFVLNFTTSQRSALLTASSTLCLLYTPANEHFGIVPVEGMLCGLPILACDSGGPIESVLASPASERTG
ncbi:Alpha-1,3/1,6-mannosyltransferase ALG2 [Pleurotus pulmonarius]